MDGDERTWVGVALDAAMGFCNGTINHVSCFSANANSCVFIPKDMISTEVDSRGPIPKVILHKARAVIDERVRVVRLGVGGTVVFAGCGNIIYETLQQRLRFPFEREFFLVALTSVRLHAYSHYLRMAFELHAFQYGL